MSKSQVNSPARHDDGEVPLDAATAFEGLQNAGTEGRSGYDIPQHLFDTFKRAMAIVETWADPVTLQVYETESLATAVKDLMLRKPFLDIETAEDKVRNAWKNLAGDDDQRIGYGVKWDLRHARPIPRTTIDDATGNPRSFEVECYASLKFFSLPTSSPRYALGMKAAAVYYVPQTAYPDKNTGELRPSDFDVEGYWFVAKYFNSRAEAKAASSELWAAIRDIHSIELAAEAAGNSQYTDDPVRMGGIQRDLAAKFQRAAKEQDF